MNHSDSTEHSGRSAHSAHIVVHPPTMTTRPPYRGVEILGTVVGKAYNVADVEEFARRAGLEDVDVAQSDAVAWVGGGPGFWGGDAGE
ncbi:hypothetical protein [Streptacidiphilus carbonis]|uniref:hypothetical protein n=1 Tax=Streptacidiphilus carbonis TaxID=105422 RepID=UPI0005AA19EA|nr:hypothetical protein [Streptacidiphilus carbonis]